MRRFNIFRLSHDRKGPKSWLKHAVYIFQLFLKMSFIHLSMPHGFSTKIQQEPSHSKMSQLSWFSERQNPLLEKLRDLPYAWWNEVSSCSPQLSLEDCYNNSQAASFFTCRSLERPCTRTLRTPECGISVSRDSHDKRSCPYQRRFKLLSVIRPGLTGPERDRNTCWGFISTRSCGQSFRPPPHRCIRPSNSHSSNPYYFPSTISSAQSLASVPLSCSLLTSPLTYYWTCLISCEWAECLADGREGGKEKRRGKDRSRLNKCVYERQRDRLRTHGVVKAALFDYSPIYRLPVRRGHVGKRGMIQHSVVNTAQWFSKSRSTSTTHISELIH